MFLSLLKLDVAMDLLVPVKYEPKSCVLFPVEAFRANRQFAMFTSSAMVTLKIEFSNPNQ